MVGVMIEELLHATGAWKWSRWATFTAPLIAFKLRLQRHRQRGTKALVVDDVGLANLAQAIKDGVGQFPCCPAILSFSGPGLIR